MKTLLLALFLSSSLANATDWIRLPLTNELFKLRTFAQGDLIEEMGGQGDILVEVYSVSPEQPAANVREIIKGQCWGECDARDLKDRAEASQKWRGVFPQELSHSFEESFTGKSIAASATMNRLKTIVAKMGKSTEFIEYGYSDGSWALEHGLFFYTPGKEEVIRFAIVWHP